MADDAEDVGAEDLGKGLKAAVDLLMGEAGRAKAEGQLALFPVVEAERAELVEALRGPGRPPGSRNRSTEEWREFILGRFRSPLEFLASVYTRPVELLAVELNCKKHEAFKLQVEAARDLAPYVHRKQPQAVELDDGAQLPLILLVRPDQAAAIRRGEAVELLDITPEETQENQGVADAAPAELERAELERPAQEVDNADETGS